MPSNKSKSDNAVEFLRGFFGDKKNRSPVSRIVRASQEREAAYKKYKLK